MLSIHFSFNINLVGQSGFSLSYKFYLMNIVAVESVITIEPMIIIGREDKED